MSEPIPAVLPHAIHDALRADILAGRESPGSTVTESAVAVRFGVARSTARTAIDRLVADGLLHREAHRAARVPLLDVEDVIDLFDNRAILEGAALENLAAAGSLPAEALAAHRALREHARDDGPFAETDIAFHRALVAGQSSPRLARLHGQLMGEIELCIAQVQSDRLLTATEVAQQHQGILDAVLAGDGARAGQLARAHVLHSRDALVRHHHAATAAAAERSPS